MISINIVVPIRTGKGVAFLTNLTIFFTDMHGQINEKVELYRGRLDNEGLLHYVAIDHRPENICEIQNAACRKTGMMMELHVVKGPVEDCLVLENDDNDKLGHGCKVMLHLLRFGPMPNAALYVLIPTLPLSKQPVVSLI
jgi:hypothetical protein